MRTLDDTGKNPIIEFAGVGIPIVYDEGQPRIIMRAVINDLGLSSSWQLKELKDNHSWADLKTMKAYARGDQYRDMVTASPLTFMLWVNQVKFVSPEHQAQLDRYKSVIYNLLRSYATVAFPRAAAE